MDSALNFASFFLEFRKNSQKFIVSQILSTISWFSRIGKYP
ncbi:hypothetical protein TREAZ_0515 [Leadbettera azotonutricia ZAS-9]|uniref:Uncharacterized protein n=1 Tax=Leadbettera azotonutricia (strain ATCC BAA-888 / DSM 13862 / ZAS-9) TaxID=545695 RepID=F5YC57_LEAAZ|nr:hypothetical protein TREAZ_0515 [Leadbettera azotonutricia ZAS-9]